MQDVVRDKPIRCEHCGQEFVWTAGEQEFYATRELPVPKYCLICRGIMGARQRDPGAEAKERK